MTNFAPPEDASPPDPVARPAAGRWAKLWEQLKRSQGAIAGAGVVVLAPGALAFVPLPSVWQTIVTIASVGAVIGGLAGYRMTYHAVKKSTPLSASTKASVVANGLSRAHACAAVVVLWLSVAAGALADPLDRYIDLKLQRSHTPGAALVVIRDGKIVKMRGYGLADVERKVPVTADTVFEIGSITKQFTATAIMMLVEQGKIDLADPIGKYLSDVPETWTAITIRQLLTHTSGIPDYEEIMGYGGYRNPMTSAQIIALAAGRPLDFPPGTKWNYSNTGYYLLTLILEKISGESCARLLHKTIFAPAGMTHTRTSEPHDVIPNRSAGYEYKGGHLENRDAMQPTATGGAGMVVSTVGDLAKWDAILRRQSILRPDSYAQMWTDAPLADGKPSGYGFGWFVSSRNGHRLERHSGGTAGFTADIWRLPDDRLTIIVLGNLYSSPAIGQISVHVANALIPELRYHAIHDPNPAIAERVLDFYTHRLDADVYVKPLSAKFAAEMKGRWSESFEYFKVFGQPRSVELVERPHNPGAGSYRYRIRYWDSSRVVLFRIDEDSLIDDVLESEEE